MGIVVASCVVAVLFILAVLWMTGCIGAKDVEDKGRKVLIIFRLPSDELIIIINLMVNGYFLGNLEYVDLINTVRIS